MNAINKLIRNAEKWRSQRNAFRHVLLRIYMDQIHPARRPGDPSLDRTYCAEGKCPTCIAADALGLPAVPS